MADDFKLSELVTPSGGLSTSDIIYFVRYEGGSPDLYQSHGMPISELINLTFSTSSNLLAGYTATAYNAGTKSSGTFTPDPANGNLQRAVNGGAHTLAPPSVGSGDAVSMVVQYTNNASAGTITTSGYTLVDGDGLTTTDGDDFMLFMAVINGFSTLTVKALQ